MRFIVDLFRYIIFAFCGLAIIAAVLLLLRLGEAGLPSGWAVVGIAGGFAFLVLSLGGTAMLLSIHDRHAELVEEATELNASMQQLTAALLAQQGPRA